MRQFLADIINRSNDINIKSPLIFLNLATMQELTNALGKLPIKNPEMEKLYFSEDQDLREAARGRLSMECGAHFISETRNSSRSVSHVLQYDSLFSYCILLYILSVLAEMNSKTRLLKIKYSLQIHNSGQDLTKFMEFLNLFSRIYPRTQFDICQMAPPQKPAVSLPEQKLFPGNPEAQKIFRDLRLQACREAKANLHMLKECKNISITADAWDRLDPDEQFQYIQCIGAWGISTPGPQLMGLINMDFITLIPCCNMITLYCLANTLPESKRSFIVDVGAGEDIRELERIARLLHTCTPSFQCQIFTY